MDRKTVFSGLRALLLSSLFFMIAGCAPEENLSPELLACREHYDSGNFDQAFPCVRKAAEEGDARLYATLAFLYREGKGTEKDLEKAALWYEKGALLGQSNAQYELGVMYEDGQGVMQNDVKAFYWYKKAADQDFTSAQVNLASMYRHGRVVERNWERAYHLYLKAAEKGDVTARYNLALMTIADMVSNLARKK